jgi:exodeoxyribonuclease VII small subunit
MVKKAKENEIKYEDALDRLEKIIDLLQEGKLSLDESLDAFQEGIKLLKLCRQRLDDADMKVKLLIKDEAGNMSETPFDIEGES